jgi:hypothetical protein
MTLELGKFDKPPMWVFRVPITQTHGAHQVYAKGDCFRIEGVNTDPAYGIEINCSRLDDDAKLALEQVDQLLDELETAGGDWLRRGVNRLDRIKVQAYKGVMPTHLCMIDEEKVRLNSGSLIRVLNAERESNGSLLRVEAKYLGESAPGDEEEQRDPWAHRSEGMRCKTCMWMMFKGENKQIGRCRRRAPTMGGYPVVKADDWCGDHRLDETK